ncbi:S-phase kinase-associated protein 2-like [Clytia hemisphaerica]|uniref:F-box domain-containing protein n=1 Tax=Clytia hemisphaerica TaxID=252671 RepID=A0A7M5ULN7_9CNID
MASSQQSENNGVKYRPREEIVYQQFLQADLEVQTIDWKDDKVEDNEEVKCTPDDSNEVCDSKRPRVPSASNSGSSSESCKSKKKKCKIVVEAYPTRTKCEPQTYSTKSKSSEITTQYKRDVFGGGCSSLCLKDQTNHFASLFDELVLIIFKHFSRTTILNCMRVSKRWNRLGSDSSLWKSVNCDSKHFIMEGQLGKILHRGVESLRLSKAEVLANICIEDCALLKDEIECEFQLKQLDCSMSKFKDEALSTLILNCKQLENLSLESCKLNPTVLSGVGLNRNLRVLNLALCVGLNIGSLDMITRQCQQITSLNLSWTNQTRDAIRTICRCRELRELNLSGLRGGVNRKYMELLVKNCNKLMQLDLSDVALQIGSLKLIADNLTSLTTLSISRCSDVRSEQLFDLKELRSLSHLNLFGFLNMSALELFSETRPDVHINKHTFSPIARPISSASYEGRLWEQYVGFII